MQTLTETIDNTESKEYSVVRLSKNNLKDLAKLHAEVYNDAVSNIYFQMKYDTAYTGIENAGFIVYNKDGQPVAYYGVIPCFIQYKKEIILAAQSADTMTHPKHRYKGMFVELSHRTFDLCRELGIRLIFGFPNQNSYHGAVKKLGWKMTETLACFTIPVKSLPIQSVLSKLKLSSLYKRYCNLILHNKSINCQGTLNSVVSNGFAGVARSTEYLNYKTYSSTKVIQISGSRIWISIKHVLLIGDMEDVNEKNFDMVINQLKKIAKRLGLRQIQFHCSPETSLYKLFITKHCPTSSFPVLFQDLGSSIPPEKIKFTFADIDIF